MDLDKLKQSIKEHEGLKLKPYTCPAGKLTIGYGRNLEDNGISEDEANEMLMNDLIRINEDLANAIYSPDWAHRFYLLPAHVQNVLVEMAYQMGINGLMQFEKTLDYVAEGNYKKASEEMLNSKWAKQTPNRAKKLSNLMKGGF